MNLLQHFKSGFDLRYLSNDNRAIPRHPAENAARMQYYHPLQQFNRYKALCTFRHSKKEIIFRESESEKNKGVEDASKKKENYFQTLWPFDINPTLATIQQEVSLLHVESKIMDLLAKQKPSFLLPDVPDLNNELQVVSNWYNNRAMKPKAGSIHPFAHAVRTSQVDMICDKFMTGLRDNSGSQRQSCCKAIIVSKNSVDRNRRRQRGKITLQFIL